jgi:hypothetical protein
VTLVNFGALISKIDVTQANTEAFSLVLMHTASVWGTYREDVSCLILLGNPVILVNFGVLISKIDVTRANTEAFCLVLMHTALFWGIYREDVSCLS